MSIGSGEESVEGQQQAVPASEDVLALEEIWEEPADTETPASPRSGWLLPALAIAAVAGWTAFFAWANMGAILAGAGPAQWTAWVAAWASPVLLVVALWLLVMRTSYREAHRFNDVAHALGRESTQLEKRLATVNRELSLAREFIASQSRDLEALGRVAIERLVQNADRLAGLIHDNGAQVEAIASVSTNALENMGKLRNELPVIANSARDVTNQIGNAGRVAQNHLQELVSGFHRLNEFSEANEGQVQGLRAQVDAALAAFAAQAAQLDDIASTRFAALEERSHAFQAELDSHEVDMLAAIRHRAQALSDELDATRGQLAAQESQSLEHLRGRIAELGERSATLGEELRRNENSALQAWSTTIGELENRLRATAAEIEQIESQAHETTQANLAQWNEEFAQRRDQAAQWQAQHLATTGEQLARLDQAIAERRQTHLATSHEIAQHAEGIAAHLAELCAQVEQVGAQSGTVQRELGESISALSAKLAASREALAGTDNAVVSLTDASIRLLEIIRASAQHSIEDLPAAIATAEQHLSGFVGNVEAVNLMIGDANEKGRSLSDYVIAAQRDGRDTMEEMERFHATFAAHNEAHAGQLAQFRAELEELGRASEAQAAHREQQLRDALDKLSAATQAVITGMEQGGADAAAQLAFRIGRDSAEAIDRAVKIRATEAVGQLEQAAAHASGVSREAAIQLRDQLAKVAELTSHLENRVAHARQRAEEQVDNDFARRVALITESLNSNAIDIAKALSNEVTDTAWASYLRGDRGIFTRRAVRLLDTSESRTVVEIYENDHDFREHVNRYIHDFEAMLRQLLSTRDGHALSVTLLSSDMGKLYVALAQAIERLRE